MTQHRGRHSESNRQRRFVKQLVVETARHDRVRAEKMCMLNDDQTTDALKERFDCVVVSADSFDKGEVVMDSRGKSSLQLPETYDDWKLAIDSDEVG